MPIRKYLVPAALIATLVLLAPQRAAAMLPQDFTLGPVGHVTISADADSTSVGCLNTDTSECDSYSMSIPITISTTGDFSNDLMGGPGKFLAFFFGATGQLCAHGTAVLQVLMPLTSLKLTKSATSESVKFSGLADGATESEQVMVPTSFTIKAKRKTGVGTLKAKGLAKDLFTLSGPTVDVFLLMEEADGDIDRSCATVPASFRKSP